MIKTLIFAIVLAASTALAAGFLETDMAKIKVQGYAPDGTLGQALTVASVTVDMSNKVAYGVYAPSTGCKARTMATTAKGSNLLHTVPNLQWTIRVVNKATPFVNLSGCTSGELTIQ